MRARTNQGGSIVVYVLVGLVLLAGLGAGVYYISRDSEDASQTQVAVEDEADNEQAEPRDEPEGETGDSESNDDQSNDGVIDDPDSATEDTPQSEAPDEAETLAPTGVSSELPQTGPSEMPLLGIGALAFSAAAFIRSRRLLGR